MTVQAHEHDMPPPHVSQDVLDVVHTACRRLYGSETTFVGALVVALPPLVPTLVPSPSDVLELARTLVRTVLWAGLTDDPPEVVEATLAGVASDAVPYGLGPDAYHAVGHALLRAARETYQGDWTSELSSSWVAWFGWVGTHLATGARGSRTPQPTAPTPAPGLPADAAGMPPGAPAGAPPVSGPLAVDRVPDTLDEVLAQLHARHFAPDDPALDSVLSRVALRTGADLRAPRPDQQANPAVVANVLAVLAVMGYLDQPSDGPADRAPARRARRLFR